MLLACFGFPQNSPIANSESEQKWGQGAHTSNPTEHFSAHPPKNNQTKRPKGAVKSPSAAEAME